MNHSGNNDPRRRQRPRAPQPGRGDEYLRGRDGKPLLDRYGRPVRRRAAPPRPQNQQPAPRDYGDRDFAGGESYNQPPQQQRRPQQYVPPRGAAAPQHTAYLDSREAARPSYEGGPAYNAPAYQPPTPPRPPAPPRGPAPKAPKPRKPRRPRRMGCGCFGWPVAAVLALLLVFTLWADTTLTRVEAMPDQQIHKTSGTNWLLVGSDSRQGLSDKDIERLGTGGDIGVGRTDTIMLLHIPTTGKATLVSLPRDSYVEVPGYGMDKINAAFTYGGPQLLTTTVENATGVHINHYAEIGMGGLAKVVDAVGGVPVCPTEDIDDPLANLSITAGCQKVDGPTALGYVRTRATAQGDLDRVERQREFFSALLGSVTKPSTLINPFRLLRLMHTTASSFTVGKHEHVWNLARVALAMRSGVDTETVPVGGFADYDVGNVVLWDDEASEALWQSLR